MTGTLDEALATQVAAQLMTLDATGDDGITLQVDCAGGSLDAAVHRHRHHRSARRAGPGSVRRSGGRRRGGDRGGGVAPCRDPPRPVPSRPARGAPARIGGRHGVRRTLAPAPRRGVRPARRDGRRAPVRAGRGRPGTRPLARRRRRARLRAPRRDRATRPRAGGRRPPRLRRAATRISAVAGCRRTRAGPPRPIWVSKLTRSR